MKRDTSMLELALRGMNRSDSNLVRASRMHLERAMKIAKEIPSARSKDAKRIAIREMLDEHLKAFHADGVRWGDRSIKGA